MIAVPKQAGKVDNGPTEGKVSAGQLAAYIKELTEVLQKLGEPGYRGVLSPAIYDTAQLLRYEPPDNPAEVEQLVEWLLTQQQPDGGWGGSEGIENMARHAPTLAAILALHETDLAAKKKRVDEAVRKGIDFLNTTSGAWRSDSADSLPDDIPVAAELTLPMLLDEAIQKGLQISPEPFKALRALGEKRKRLISKMLFIAPGTKNGTVEGRAPMHTWEAWKKTGRSISLLRFLFTGLGWRLNLVASSLAFSRISQVYRWVGGLAGLGILSLGLYLLEEKVLPAGVDLPDSELRNFWIGIVGFWLLKLVLWALAVDRRGPGPASPFGLHPMDVMDGSRGIGHSPVATASWLRDLRGFQQSGRSWGVRTQIQKLEEEASQFLKDAEKATLTSIPGVFPTVWPINRFEQSWALFGLYVMGLLEKQGPLSDEASKQLDELHRLLKENKGLGMSDYFVCDGDITATTIFLLVGTGRSNRDYGKILKRFMRGKHFITYDYELQPSVTTTAHATMACTLLRRDTSHLVDLLLNWQDPESGYWRGDKWHKSWLYTTAQVMIALACAEKNRSLGTLGQQALLKGLKALLDNQHQEGGWGFTSVPTLAETAYAVQALYALKDLPPLSEPNVTKETVVEVVHRETLKESLRRAARWMTDQEAKEEKRRQASPEEYLMSKEKYWIGKELYCPYRVDRVFELSALVALESDPELRSSP